jgi:site-specific DNA recombinase
VKVVLYARVSSEKQVEKDLSIAAQLKALRKYAAERGWEVCREFVDEAQSARTANRPAFKEMIALARKKQKLFDAILVWKLSRFARNREDSIIYKSLLRKHGISVISINEQVDESPAGKLLEGMIEVIDEFYSTNLAQDTLRGMKENASRGYHCGGTIPIGYKAKKVKDGANEKTRLVPDEVFAPIVTRIFKMCEKGMGAKDIVKILNGEGLKTNRGRPWSKSTTYCVLKNETYTGTLVWNRQNKRHGMPRLNDQSEVIRIENNHPAIVSREAFEKAQNLLKKRSPQITHPRTVNSGCLLSGLLYCGKCGLAMLGCAAKSSKYFYYACHNYCKRGKDVCDARLVNKDRLESFVIDRIKANILTEDNLTELVKLTNEEIRQSKGEAEEKLEALDNHLGDLRERLHKLYDALETGKLGIEDLAPRIRELKAQIDNLEKQRNSFVEDMQSEEVELLDAPAVKEYADDLKSLFSKGSIMEQKSFLRSFVKRIEVNLPQVAIDYTIPLEGKKVEPLTREVLPFARNGSPGRTRTCGTVVTGIPRISSGPGLSLYHTSGCFFRGTLKGTLRKKGLRPFPRAHPEGCATIGKRHLGLGSGCIVSARSEVLRPRLRSGLSYRMEATSLRLTTPLSV